MRRTVWICLVVFIISFMISSAFAEEYTLEQTLERLLDKSTRGQIIKGQFEVSQAKFNAEKIGYYLPEISLNSTVPSLTETENFAQFYGFTDPILAKRRTNSRTGDIRLQHKVITGGDITIRGYVYWRDAKYPSTINVYDEDRGEYVSYLVTAKDKTLRNTLSFEFSQPIFNTSDSRSAYNSAKTNMEQAQIQWRVDQADLKKEGVTAFFDLLMVGLDKDMADKNSKLAVFNAQWDSVKYADGIMTEEEWVESQSTRLEKRLALYDAEASYEEKLNEYKHLLDIPNEQSIALQSPPTPSMPAASKIQWLKANAEYTAETELARMKMESSERDLKNTRSGGGLNGTLRATYQLGKEDVTISKEYQNDDIYLNDINDNNNDTKDWQISVELSYPLWDGGASKANVRSSELAYESSRLEYLAAQRNAKNKMEIAIKRMEINFSKLQLLEDELKLADKKLKEAKDKFQEGLISEGDLLENEVYYLEAAKNRLTTLKDYYHDLIELEKTDTP
ncbi:MAG: TolC family protein [Candidatus Zixiibacteriota bacterium]